MTVAYNTNAILPYLGNSSSKVFPITFPTYENTNIKAFVSDLDGVITALSETTDYTLATIGRPGQNASLTLVDASDVAPGWVGPIPPRQAWLSPSGNLLTGWYIFIKFDLIPKQPTVIRAKTLATRPESIETIVDRLTMNVAALYARIQRMITFTDYTFEVESGVPITGEDLIELQTILAALQASGGALPLPASDGQFIESDLSDPSNYVLKDGAFSGFSARFGSVFTSTGLHDTISKILDFAYLGPQVSFSASGSGTVREKGTVVAATTLSATVTQRTDPIARINFKKDGVSVDDNNPPSNTGSHTETYGWTGSFSDNTSFSVEVTDDGTSGGPTTVSGSASFVFVYPYYSGSGAVALSAANVALLTKDVRTSTASLNKVFNPTGGQVHYFAYPASYGALTSIKDENLFETFSDWTLRTENITGLDGNPVSYRIYEFNNPVVAGTTNYTFIR